MQETISRFPNSSNSDAYKWHLAKVRAIIGKRDSDNWIISQIQKEIRSERVTIDTLNNFLIPNGFFVKTSKGYNVFGDNRQVWVLQVTLNIGNKRDGLFLVVKQDEDLKYIVYKLGSYWSFTNSYSNVDAVGDYNKNGYDEVLVKVGWHSGTICGSRMRMFEWNGNDFVDITRGEIAYDHCGGNFEFGPDTQDGATTVLITLPLENSSQLRYIWNGRSYILSNVVNSSVWETWKDSVRIGILSYPAETQMLKDLLNSKEINNNGSSYPNYLRYRLGVVLALQSRRTEAIDEFEKIIASSSNRSDDLFPRVAKSFIELYQDDTTLYRACLATNRIYERLVKAQKSPNGSIDILKVEGINLEWFDLTYSTPLCDLNAAFTKTLNTVPSDDTNLIASLDSLGVEIQSLYQVDLDTDGNNEWLIRLDPKIWAIVYQRNNRYSCVILNSFGWTNGFIQEIEDVHVFQVPESSKNLFLLRSDDSVWLFEVDDDFQMTYIQSEYSVENLSLEQLDGMLVLQLFPKKSSSEFTFWEGWRGLRWNEDEREFTDDLLEYQLLSVNRFDLAKDEITDLLPYYPQMNMIRKLTADPARYCYLAALASELSGDSKNAVDIYRQLWHDFPEKSLRDHGEV
ncbi:MAG: hypothetical protein QM730_06635 [Anaerolineales bacterium]